MAGRAGRIGAAIAVALLLASCTIQLAGRGRPNATLSPSCPASYAAPDPARPQVALTFAVSAGHTTVSGTEHITFTPDLPITELVFRLTANTRPTVAEGNKIVVTSARADHGASAATYTSAAADPSTQGGLLHIPFGRELPAGTSVTADLTFTVTLGPESFDRFGRTGGYAWFASAQPLLRVGAWLRVAHRADAALRGGERHQRGDADRPDRDRAGVRHGDHVGRPAQRRPDRRRSQDMACDARGGTGCQCGGGTVPGDRRDGCRRAVARRRL